MMRVFSIGLALFAIMAVTQLPFSSDAAAATANDCETSFTDSVRFLECSQDMIQAIKSLDNQVDKTPFSEMNASSSQRLKKELPNFNTEADRIFASFTADTEDLALQLAALDSKDAAAFRQQYFLILSHMRQSLTGLYEAENGMSATLSRRFYSVLDYINSDKSKRNDLKPEEKRYFEEMAQHISSYQKLRTEFAAYAKSR